MPANLLNALGYIAAIIFGGVGLYYWRRSASLYALLVEGANRFEELRQRGQQLEQNFLSTEDRLKQSREQAGRLENAIAEARQRAADYLKKYEQKEHELQIFTDKLELQKAHLEKQLSKALDYIQQSDSQRQQLQTDHQELSAQMQQLRHANDARQNTERRELEAQVKELSLKLKAQDKDMQALARKAKESDPVELKRLRRKIAQYDRLYASMKGLREMSDERNRNWEVALRQLSDWILRESGALAAGAPMPEAIGPLVGQALQIIGVQLVDDDETSEAQHPDVLGASRETAVERALNEE